MFDFLGVTTLVLLASSGTWVALRARRAENRVVKWAGLILSTLFMLAWEGMPLKGISAVASDADLKAIYLYIHGLPPMNDSTN